MSILLLIYILVFINYIVYSVIKILLNLVFEHRSKFSKWFYACLYLFTLIYRFYKLARLLTLFYISNACCTLVFVDYFSLVYSCCRFVRGEKSHHESSNTCPKQVLPSEKAYIQGKTIDRSIYDTRNYSPKVEIQELRSI